MDVDSTHRHRNLGRREPLALAMGSVNRQQGRDYNMPTQRSVEMKLFEVKETVISHTTGTQTHRTPLITGKGQTYFYNLLKNWPGLKRQATPV